MARSLYAGSDIQASDTNGVPYSGAKMQFYLTGTTTPVSVYAAAVGGSTLANPVVSDSAGRFVDIFLDVDVTYRVKLTDSTGSDTIYDLDPVTAGVSSGYVTNAELIDDSPSGASLVMASDGRTVQQHLDDATALGIGLFTSFVGTPPVLASTVKQVYSSGYGALGVGIARYIYDAAVNAAYVTAWPNSAFLSADSRGWRLDPKQSFFAEMWGCKCDTAVTQFTYTTPAFTATRSITPGTDNLAPALEALKYAARWINTTYRHGPPVHFTGGEGATAYYFSDTIEPVYGAYIKGISSGLFLSGGTVFLFPANKGGIKLLHNTAGGTKTYSAIGTVIEGIYFYGSGGSTRTAHGLKMRVPCIVRDCCFDAFAGDGVNNQANIGISSTLDAWGTTSGSRLERIMTRQSGNWGMYSDGSDASASQFDQIQVQGARLGGIYENTYFGNTYIAPEIDSCGEGNKGQVHYLGRWYTLIYPTAGLGASTTPGTNNLIWYDRGAGGITTQFPDWSGAGSYEMSIAIGGPWDGCNGTFIHPYVEGTALTSTGGGGIVGGIGPITSHTHRLSPDTYGFLNSKGWVVERAYSPAHATYGATWRVEVGGLEGQILGHSRSASSEASWRQQQNGPDISYGYGGIGSGIGYTWFATGPNTAEAYGSGTAVPYAFLVPNFVLGGPVSGNGRRMSYGTAAPTTGAHARGEIVFDIAPSSAGKIGWVCTTAGTPGTWKTWGTIS